MIERLEQNGKPVAQSGHTDLCSATGQRAEGISPPMMDDANINPKTVLFVGNLQTGLTWCEPLAFLATAFLERSRDPGLQP